MFLKVPWRGAALQLRPSVPREDFQEYKSKLQPWKRLDEEVLTTSKPVDYQRQGELMAGRQG